MLTFCLFTFNRGRFLENCIASIEACAPGAALYIFDDNSDEEYTINVLNKAREKHTVVQPPKAQQGSSKFGGLYNNMIRAVEMMPDDARVCFIQDDMQCVRKITQQDIDDIDEYFAVHPNAAFLHPAFVKGGKRERDKKSMQLDDASNVYFRHNVKQSAGVHFSAIIIFIPGRLRETGWEFAFREKLNDQQAGEKYGKMGLMCNPFCLWLPNVPAFRGKRKTLALKLAERMRKSDLYAVEIMDDEQAHAFCHRDKSQLPVAEDFLTLKKGPLKTPWAYYALDGLTFMKYLNRLELFFMKYVSKP